MTDAFFHAPDHLRDISQEELLQLVDDRGGRIPGISGATGARAVTGSGTAMGIDRIVLSARSSFPLHTHDGDHLLYVAAGSGAIHIDGTEYDLRAGQTVFVPAVYPHGLVGPATGRALEVIAFSNPHHPIDSRTRMSLVAPGDGDLA